MRVRRKMVVLAAVMVGVTAVRADSASWQVLPCWGGGYVQDVLLCPSDRQRLYTYVDVGGPYRSDDAGRNWRPLHGNMSVEMRERGFDRVRSMSVDPRNADSFVILGGGSEAANPGGFAVSRDGGLTWRITGTARAYGNGPRRMEGRCLSRNPFAPDELVGGEDYDGIFVSRDNGESWTRTGPTNIWYSNIAYDLAVTGRIYACGSECPSNMLAKAWMSTADRMTRQHGFFRSDDGGRSWTRISDQSPWEITQIPGDRRIVGIFARKEIRASDDGGVTWKDFSEGVYSARQFSWESCAKGNYYAIGSGRDFYLLGDGNGNKYRRGKKDALWSRLPSGVMSAGDPRNEPRLQGRSPNAIRQLALMTLVADPNDDGHWFATDWYDIWETGDAGNSWTSRVTGIMQLVSYDLVFDPLCADNFCCCLYDVGAFLTQDGGRTFRSASYALDAKGRRFPNNIVTARYSAKTSGLLLAAGARGWDVGLWRSRDAGRSWEPLDGRGLPPLKADVHVVSTIVEDRDGSFLVTVSGAPSDGGGGIYRSRDQGESWTWEGTGLPSLKGFDFGTTHSQGCWPRLALSPDGTAVTCGQHGCKELLSLDLGTGEWKPNGLSRPDWRRYPLAADPHTPGRFLRGGPGDAVESTDGGKTWHVFRPLKGRLCRAFAFDRHHRGLVAFGCKEGIFVSYDGGATVHRLKAGLDAPTGVSRNIVLDRGRLFIMTTGSGVYRFKTNLIPAE